MVNLLIIELVKFSVFMIINNEIVGSISDTSNGNFSKWIRLGMSPPSFMNKIEKLRNNRSY